MDFITWINSCDRNLKFTHTMDSESIVFLDITITKENNRLETKTCQKPTSKNNLLRFESFHPRPLRENLPYGQYLRLRRNCSKLTDYHTQALPQTGKEPTRWSPPGRKTDTNHGNSLDMCYHLQYNIQWGHKVHQKTLENFRDWEKPLFSFKKARSLKDTLVNTCPKKRDWSDTATVLNAWDLPNITGHHPCGSCSVCCLTTTTKTLNLEPGKVWTQRTHTNCNSVNVIYLITCPCGLRYVGMTIRKIKQRICEHQSTIRCKRVTTKLTEHFLAFNHTTNDIRWTVI